jgi:hypothetical protein
MPFEMPWVRRWREGIESREGCANATRYARKTQLLIDEFQRMLGRVAKQGHFKQYDYSNMLGIMQEHAKREPPAAAADLHSAMTTLFEDTRDGIRRLDPTGYQSPEEVRELLDNAIRLYEPVGEASQQFKEVCLS